MYAIVEIAGHQFKIQKDQKLFVNRLESDTGTDVEFDKVLLVADDNNIQVGAPLVEGAKVRATILDHVKADKIIVFKKKRRKGYQKKNGHRQPMTQIFINDISV